MSYNKSPQATVGAPVSVDRTWILGELKKCLRALVLDDDHALVRAPSGSCMADELALDYNNFLSAAFGSFKREFTSEQVLALQRVNELLSDMSGEDKSHLWTDEAVRSHPRWQEVRFQARAAARALGWEEQA